MSTSASIDHLIDIALGNADPALDEIEHRGNRRADCTAKLAIVQWTPSGEKSITTVVRCKNICPRGLCIISSYMLHVGNEGVVLLERSNGEQVLLGIRVVHCRYIGDMTHESGAVIVDRPRAFSIEDFRDPAGALPNLSLAA